MEGILQGISDHWRNTFRMGDICETEVVTSDVRKTDRHAGKPPRNMHNQRYIKP